MKIMLTADTYVPDINGCAIFTHNLAAGLAEHGHEVHVIAPSPIGKPYRELQDGVHEHRMKSHEAFFMQHLYLVAPWEIDKTVRRIIKTVKPDIVHTQSHLMVGRCGAKWARELGIPLVATNHFMPEFLLDQLPRQLPKLLRRAIAALAWMDIGRVYASADKITAATPTAVSWVKKHAKLGGIVPVSSGVKTEKFRNVEVSKPDDIPHLLFVGRLEDEKRVNEVIEALALLQPSTKLHFDIVGNGSLYDELRQYAANLRVLDRITFHGFLTDKDLVKMFVSCDIFVNAGIAELQSIVTLEALAAGKPVILANAMAMPHLVRHGQNGYLFEPGDVEALAAYIEELALNPQLRKFMGKTSLEVVKAYEFSNTLRTFEELYQTVIAEHTKSRGEPISQEPEF